MKKFFARLGITILIILGLVLIFNQQIMNFVVSKATENQVENVTKENIKKGKKAKADFNFKSVKSISPTEVGKGVFASFPIVGRMEVPSVGVKLPIGRGISEGVLYQGAGTMKPNEKMGEGNYALAGHHVRNREILFSPLTHVKTGANIYLTDLNRVYKYKIYSKKVIQPTEVETIDDVQGKKIVTLITCADAGTKRWAIKGELVSNKVATKQALNEPKKEIKKIKNHNNDYLMYFGVAIILIVILIWIKSRSSKKKSSKK